MRARPDKECKQASSSVQLADMFALQPEATLAAAPPAAAPPAAAPPAAAPPATEGAAAPGGAAAAAAEAAAAGEAQLGDARGWDLTGGATMSFGVEDWLARQPLASKTVVFTGALQMPRAEASARAVAAGAKVGSTITGKTDILVAGEKPGSNMPSSKVDAARAKGVDVWTEAQFVAAAAAASGTATPLPAASVPAPSPGESTAGGEAMRAELAALPRKELQARAKAAGLKANAKSLLLVEQLLALAADG